MKNSPRDPRYLCLSPKPLPEPSGWDYWWIVALMTVLITLGALAGHVLRKTWCPPPAIPVYRARPLPPLQPQPVHANPEEDEHDK